MCLATQLRYAPPATPLSPRATPRRTRPALLDPVVEWLLLPPRGNHETKNMNKIYGFEGEVKSK